MENILLWKIPIVLILLVINKFIFRNRKKEGLLKKFKEAAHSSDFCWPDIICQKLSKAFTHFRTVSHFHTIENKELSGFLIFQWVKKWNISLKRLNGMQRIFVNSNLLFSVHWIYIFTFRVEHGCPKIFVHVKSTNKPY